MQIAVFRKYIRAELITVLRSETNMSLVSVEATEDLPWHLGLDTSLGTCRGQLEWKYTAVKESILPSC